MYSFRVAQYQPCTVTNVLLSLSAPWKPQCKIVNSPFYNSLLKHLGWGLICVGDLPFIDSLIVSLSPAGHYYIALGGWLRSLSDQCCSDDGVDSISRLSESSIMSALA